jgi:Dimethlysulfonioproprionate lyase
MTIELQLADLIKPWLISLNESAFDPYLAQWPAGQRSRANLAVPLPVLRWISHLPSGALPLSEDIVSAFCSAAPALTWRRTYSAADLGDEFLNNYAWSEIFGAHSAFHSARIACGFLLLGPSTAYPRHHHEAEEVYVPLSGTAEWLQGDELWRHRPPGTAIVHASGEIHAMQTGAQPLLALYLWRSANLLQKAQLDL